MLRLLHLNHGSLADCSNRSLSPIGEMDLLSIAPAVNLCFSVVVVVAAALALTLVIAVPTLAVVVALVLTLVIVRGSHFVVVIAILL